MECLVEAKFYASSDEFFVEIFIFRGVWGQKTYLEFLALLKLIFFCDKSLPMPVECLLRTKFYAGSDGEKKSKAYIFKLLGQNTIVRAFWKESSNLKNLASCGEEINKNFLR